MPAYIVFIKEREHDAEAMAMYSQNAAKTLDGHEFKALSFYGKVESLEGPPLLGAVVIEFPTFEAAKAWYASDAYQDVRKHRFQGGDYRAFITEGM